jgi:hypothetical protein
MRWLRRFSRTKRESDLDREIRAHLELEAEEQQEAGRSAGFHEVPRGSTGFRGVPRVQFRG